MERPRLKLLGVYTSENLAVQLKSLAHRREISLAKLVRGICEREISQAQQSGEWTPRETPTVEVTA